MALMALTVIGISAAHTQKNYKTTIPLTISIASLLLLVKICYQIVCVFSVSGWDINPLKYDANNGFVYGLGYAPVVVMLAIMVWNGWKEENEDVQLIKLRRQRDFNDEVELKEMRRQQGEEKRRAQREADLEAANKARTAQRASPEPSSADGGSTLVEDQLSTVSSPERSKGMNGKGFEDVPV